MSRYMLDKVLWRYAREPEFKAAFDADSGKALNGLRLTSQERLAMAAADLRAIFKLGAHPFLLYSFAIALNGGWSMEMMKDYVARLDGLALGDIET